MKLKNFNIVIFTIFSVILRGIHAIDCDVARFNNKFLNRKLSVILDTDSSNSNLKDKKLPLYKCEEEKNFENGLQFSIIKCLIEAPYVRNHDCSDSVRFYFKKQDRSDDEYLKYTKKNCKCRQTNNVSLFKRNI